jgi:hypothetical protein
MASAQATAERYAASHHSIQAAIASLSAKHGIAIPPPAPKSDTPDAKAAGELDRVAQFMAQLAGMSDPGGYQPGVPVPGSIGDGYVDSEANPDGKPTHSTAELKELKKDELLGVAQQVGADVSPGDTKAEIQKEIKKAEKK